MFCTRTAPTLMLCPLQGHTAYSGVSSRAATRNPRVDPEMNNEGIPTEIFPRAFLRGTRLGPWRGWDRPMGAGGPDETTPNMPGTCNIGESKTSISSSRPKTPGERQIAKAPLRSRRHPSTRPTLSAKGKTTSGGHSRAQRKAERSGENKKDAVQQGRSAGATTAGDATAYLVCSAHSATHESGAGATTAGDATRTCMQRTQCTA